MRRRTVILVVLDGWGIGSKDGTNPIHAARLTHFPRITERYPVTSLQASGISVGLPWGEVGNSEVGHLTLGAGKVLYQHYPRITLAIRDKTFFENHALKGAFDHARANKSCVHLVGLLTKANVHASIEHLNALLAFDANIPVKLHLFADGVDSPQRSFEELVSSLPQENIATITGRLYAMDRDGNWQLTQRAYDNLTASERPVTRDIRALLQTTYERDKSEAYLPPLRIRDDAAIKDGDALIFFNYREDSMRQMSSPFTMPSFHAFPTISYKDLYVTTMTQYEKNASIPVAFPPETVEQPLGQVLGNEGKTQLRIAETYKYAHVTYFFNGLREEPYENEFRALIPSLQAPHQDKQPKLRAPAITDRLIAAIEDSAFDFILVNYANADTIGHTGNFDAGVETAQVIDEEIGRVLKTSESADATLIITADHGNLERMRNAFTWQTEGQHDPNPVPFHLVGKAFEGRQFLGSERRAVETGGVLADVAPTILEIMHIQKPPQMTGRSLLQDLM